MNQSTQENILILPKEMRLTYPVAASPRTSRAISKKMKALRGEIELFDPTNVCWQDGSMKAEPDVSQLGFYPEYLRSVQETGIPSYVHICHVNNDVQYGVFASEAIDKGEFIGIYSGELGMGEYNTDSHYLFEIIEEESIYVDAQGSGNFTRYINHTASKNCNVGSITFLTKYKLFTIPVIILYAAKKITSGEQLLYNYGNEYWKAMGVKPAGITPNTYVMN